VLSKEFVPKLIAALLADDTYFANDSKGTTAGVGFRGKTKYGGVVTLSGSPPYMKRLISFACRERLNLLHGFRIAQVISHFFIGAT